MNINLTQYRHLLTSKNIITGLAGVFAILSMENVTLWFRSLGHPALGAIVAGLAIGSALVILAHQLSGVSYRDGKAFWGLLSVTLVLVALSGGISGSVYAKHLGWFGYVMAFVIAITGEIALPMAHGWHEESQRNKAVVSAGIIAEQKAAQTLIDTFDNLDTTKAKKAAEKRIEALIVANVDDIVQRLMPTPHVAHSERNETVSAIDETQTPNSEFGPQNLPVANEVRRSKKDERQQNVYELLRDTYDGLDATKLNRSQMARELGCSESTIRSDLRALEDAQLVSLNGVVNVR